MGNPITRWWSCMQRKVLDLATQAPGLYRYPLGLDLEILFFSITSPKIRSGSDLEDLQNSFEDLQSSFCSSAAFLLLIAFPWSESHQTKSKTLLDVESKGRREYGMEKEERGSLGRGKSLLNSLRIRVGRRVLFIDLLWSNSSSSQPITTLCEIRSKSDWLE